MDPKNNNEYFSKFLTPKQNLAPRNNDPVPKNPPPSTKMEGTHSNISQMTYGFFINQTKDLLYKNFFKNKTEASQKPKNNFNPPDTKKTQRSKSKNNTEKIDKAKKKELLEEIIRANSESIRNNNFFKKDNTDGNSQKNEEKKFNLENLYPNQAASIHLENEIELRRKLLEKKHEDIINSNLPDIINSIEELVSDENNFYFMKNKYSQILEEYENL